MGKSHDLATMASDGFTFSGALTLSGGAYLGGTGSANHLDDYQEGTWTPKMGDNSTTMSTVRNASYIKIGRLVTISVDVTCPSYSGASTNFMYGLPFAGAYGSSGNGGGAVGYTVTPNVAPTIHVTSNTNALFFMNMGTGTAGEALSISGMRLIFGLTYETT